MGPRHLPDHLLYVIDSGCCAGRIAGTAYTGRAGNAFWLPPGCPHELHAVPGRAPIRVHHLRFAADCAVPGPLLTRHGDLLRPAVARLLGEHRRPGPLHAQRQRAALVSLLAELIDAATADRRPGLADEQRRAVLDLVDAQPPAVRLHPRQLARAAGLPPTRFGRLFTASFGISPRSWLKRQRLQAAAARLLECDAPIAAVATAFGYREAFRFSRQFREVLGCSPRQWRQRHGG